MLIKGKRDLLANALLRTGVLDVIRRLGSDDFVVFNYHRIRPDDDSFRTPFDAATFGPTVSEFERQVGWLVRNEQLISEEDFLSHLGSGRPLPKRSALITFDDGYRDNYTLAYPILKQHSAPALFFIPTQHIDERELGWWDVIAYLIKRTTRPYLDYDGVQIPLRGDRSDAIRFFLQKMSLDSVETTRELIGKLAAACAVASPSAAEQDAELMTWDQIRDVSRHGVAIGSHGHTHRVLATLDSASQHEEMTISKTKLERELGKTIRSLAYPVGGYAHFTAESRKIAKDCGYQAGFSFNTGINGRLSLTAFDIKRVAAPHHYALLAATAVFPRLFSERR